MNFSVCLIGRNEEKTLPKLLGSLHEFLYAGGEVVYVDTGSKDDTANLARELGCRVIEVGDRFRITLDKQLVKDINNYFNANLVKVGDSVFDYSSARNYAASVCTNNVVAMPDCDEAYTRLDLDKINNVIAEGAEQLEYNFVFSHDEAGREAIKFRHCKFYDTSKLKWTGIVHEVLTGDAKKGFLDESIIKLEHFQNQETNRSGYLTGLALDCYKNPSNDRNSHYLGRELLWRGFTNAAISELTRHLQISTWKQERGQSMLYLGDAFEKLGNKSQAIYWRMKAIEEDSTRREPYLALAEYYFRENDHQRTACFAAASLQIPHNNFYANNVALYREYPHELLYWAYWYLDRKEESKEHFQIAMNYVKKDKYLKEAQFYYDLPKVTIILPTLGREEGLKKCLSSIENLNYPKELIETLVIEDSPRLGVPKRVNEGYRKGTGSVFCFAANDIEFTPNSLILAVIYMIEGGDKLVSFNTGEYTDSGNICEHFIISKDLVEEFGGQIFDEEFHHVGVDKLLWEKARRINQARLCKEAIVNHHHFSRIGSNIEMDEVNKIGWSHVEEDRQLLDRKLKELQNA